MRFVKYTLNKDGTIPDYIIDGGYFTKPNGKKSPQDYDMIGISNSDVGLGEFTTKGNYESYVRTFENENIINTKKKKKPNSKK